MSTPMKLMVAFTLTLLTSLDACAHYLWIEPAPARGAKLYFGEYQEGIREKSGGRLDEIPGPSAWSLDAGGARAMLDVTRKSDHFDLGMPGTARAVIAEERGYEVKDWYQFGHGIVKPMFYARLSALPIRSASKPQLVLDILPEAGSSNSFTVYFRNEPLAKAKITIYAPNQWLQEHRADENGKVTITTPWPGQYVLEVIHPEKQQGEFQGQKFEAIRHRATLTFKARAAAHDK